VPVVRLRRSRPDGPGLSPRRRGRGWDYRDFDGAQLTDRNTIDRIKALVIPPAWQRVWISPWPNGHIQATGMDAAGRKHYLYRAE